MIQQEEHTSLGFKWQAGIINDRQLFDFSFDLLNSYLKNSDGQNITMEISELSEMSDSIIKASKKMDLCAP